MRLELLEERRLLSVSRDPTFDNDGIVVESNLGDVVDIAILAGNEVLAATGQSIVKYRADGSRDSGFGTGGSISIPAMAVEVQSDGRIVTAGLATNASGIVEIVVTRFNADGTLDLSFATPNFGADVIGGGISFGVSKYTWEQRVLMGPKETREHFDMGETPRRKLGLAIQSDGDIVVAANIGGDVVVTRFDATGTLDNAFDSDGMVRNASSTFGGPVVVNDLSIWADPGTGELKPVVVGTINNGANADMFVARYRANGTLDSNASGGNTPLSNSGFVIQNISGEDVAESVAVDGNGNILVVGSSAQNGHDFALIRLLGTGAIDTSFANSGAYTKDFGGHDFAHDVTVNALGNIVIVGDQPGSGYNYNWTIVELDRDGNELDVTSGAHDSDGGDPPKDDRAWAVAIDHVGLIVVGGHNDPAFVHRIPLVDPETLDERTFEGDGQIGRFLSGADTDGDGLLDIWETRGIDGNNDGTIDLAIPNADPRHKDLYVEVDFMSEDTNGNGVLDPGEDVTGDGNLDIQRPDPDTVPGVVAAGLGLATGTSFDRAVEAFLNAPVDNPDGTRGIRLHIEIDEATALMANLPRGVDDLGPIKDNRNPAVAGGFGTVAQRQAQPNANQRNPVLDAKRRVYRYTLIGNQYIKPNGDEFGGNGELPGNDTFLANQLSRLAPDSQAALFMHELGHNLGLGHGGAGGTGPNSADDVNFKPNYKSIMNYSWSFPLGAGLPWDLDFSREAAPDLDETALVESAGLGFSINEGTEDANANGVLDVGEDLNGNGTIDTFSMPIAGTPRFALLRGAVDWDNDRSTDTTAVAVDVNNSGSRSTLRGRTDWDKLQYAIGDTGNFADGTYVGGTHEDRYEFRDILRSLGVLLVETPTGNGADDFTLRLSAGMLEVYDNNTESVVATQSLASTTAVHLMGAENEDDTFTINFDSGGFFSLGAGIQIDGRGGGRDQLRVVGGGRIQSGFYLPDGRTPGTGILQLDSIPLLFLNLEPVTISGVENFTFVTPNSNDVITVDSPVNGQNRISGASGGVAFEALTFFDIENFTIDAATNDAANPKDTVTVSAPGLVASNLQNFLVQTGKGDDTFRITSGRLSPTVGNVPIRWQAGDGTDELIAEGDADFILTDDRLTSSQGGSVLFESIERGTLTGGPSNNVLDASAFTAGPTTLAGKEGNDTLAGSSAVDSLLGGPADDVLVDSPGYDTYDGGDGNDTLLVLGSVVNDIVTVRQTNATTLIVNSNGTENSNSVPNMEVVRIEAGDGDDLVGVSVADSLITAGPPDTDNGSLAFRVIGGGPNASDRMVVRDDGPGDLVIHRQGPDGRSGSIRVGPLKPVDYEGVEHIDITPLDPVTGRTGDGVVPGTPDGQLVVFRHDDKESNATRLVATRLGGSPTFVPHLNIDPGPVQLPDPFEPLPGDEDWFEFRPPKIGTFQFQVRFKQIDMLPSGRQGLPGNGNLQIEVFDASGTSLASLSDAQDDKSLAISMAADTPYYLRVRGVADAINVYDLDVSEIDLLGPQVFDPDGPVGGIHITEDPDTAAIEEEFDLFAQKGPGGMASPTPRVDGITIHLRDPLNSMLLERQPGDVYPALDVFAANQPGLYELVGDRVGRIPILRVLVTNNPVAAGEIATATVKLFFDQPLPDDRYTLRILDGLIDPAGNKLDGESDAAEPESPPTLPSGNGIAGGDFVARFTVDSRPEIGFYAGKTVVIDADGDGHYDITPGDGNHNDLVFQFGTPSDHRFAGKFAPNLPGFDVLAAYGNVNGTYRFLIDLNGNGAVDTGETFTSPDGAQVSAIAVAGNFDLNPNNGDEIALFDGTLWYILNNARTAVATTVNAGIQGYPIAGDFDSDGFDDLGTYQNDTFYFNFFDDGFTDPVDGQLTFGAPGVLDRPVAADMNVDGIDDIGIWIPASGTDQGTAEWRFLISRLVNNNNHQEVVPANAVLDPRLAAFDHPYSPVPLGADLAFHYGDPRALPIVGNFDPPVASQANDSADAASFAHNAAMPLDVNGDSLVSPADAHLVINELIRASAPASENPSAAPLAATASTGGKQPQYYLDVNADGRVSLNDALLVINHLLNAPGAQSDGSAEPASAAPLAALGADGLAPTAMSAVAVDIAIGDAHVAHEADNVLAVDVAASALTTPRGESPTGSTLMAAVTPGLYFEPSDEADDQVDDESHLDSLLAALDA